LKVAVIALSAVLALFVAGLVGKQLVKDGLLG
jgi:hypothetical protein